MRSATALTAVALLWVVPAAHAAPDVIRDSTFADGDWSVVTFTFGDGGLVEAAQSTDGYPPPSRRVREVVNASPSPTEFSAIWGIHLFGGKVYDPQVQGPFASVDYFEDARLVQGFGDGQATGVAVRQNGNVYVGQAGTTPAFAWTPKERIGIAASSFVRIMNGGFDGSAHPDFSASGAPIEFGFMRANSTSPGAIGYEMIALIDNWTVLINTPCQFDPDCVYPDGCFTGTCVAGVCKATVQACDDGDACTIDACDDGACTPTPLTCDDGDPCTTDACTAGACVGTPIDCDDGRECTADACTGGTCSSVITFDTVRAAIDTLLVLIEAPPCAGDGIAERTRKKLTKKLPKAREKLALADDAVKEKLLARLVGSADHLLDLALKGVGKAVDKGKMTPECGGVVQSYLTDLATTCADALPRTF